MSYITKKKRRRNR